MLFSELYSVYYNTVAKIIETAFDPSVTEQTLQKCVAEGAFSESVTTILPALKSGRWPLLHDDLSPALLHRPTMPLTLLQKRWLKAIADDPRIRLFDVDFPELAEVEPLFTREDYRVFDRYADGDPYEDERYIRHFRLLLEAMKTRRPVRVTLSNRRNERVRARFYPKCFEYSAKDDKIRILADGCKFGQFNLGRIEHCDFYNGAGPWEQSPRPVQRMELTLLVIDGRNALERVMLHFAHFEKRAECLGDGKYRLQMWYDKSDEMELVIRVLSFGPYVRVLEPERFVDLIKARLIAQQNCGMRESTEREKA